MAESKMYGMIAVIAVIGIVIVAGMAVNDRQEQQELLSVSGTYQLDVSPDQAVIVLQTQTRGLDAKQVSAENKQLMQQVMVALTAQGIPVEKVETTGVSLQRWQEWSPRDMIMVDKGYEQVTTLKVTVEDLTNVGTVLDAAVNAGANTVQDVSFELKPATEERVKQQALIEATKIAKTKANILADAADAKLDGIAQLSENSYIQPMMYNAKALMDGGMESASTPISPQQVTVQASVNIAYELK